jgi:hypothetical protein
VDDEINRERIIQGRASGQVDEVMKGKIKLFERIK